MRKDCFAYVLTGRSCRLRSGQPLRRRTGSPADHGRPDRQPGRPHHRPTTDPRRNRLQPAGPDAGRMVSFLRQRPYRGQRARPGEIKYEYGPWHSRDTGSLVGNKEFRYDPAANRPDFNARQSRNIGCYMRWNESQLVHDRETLGD